VPVSHAQAVLSSLFVASRGRAGCTHFRAGPPAPPCLQLHHGCDLAAGPTAAASAAKVLSDGGADVACQDLPSTPEGQRDMQQGMQQQAAGRPLYVILHEHAPAWMGAAAAVITGLPAKSVKWVIDSVEAVKVLESPMYVWAPQGT